jgi:hypothetical protein
MERQHGVADGAATKPVIQPEAGALAVAFETSSSEEEPEF